jgi:hypothetical protein
MFKIYSKCKELESKCKELEVENNRLQGELHYAKSLESILTKLWTSTDCTNITLGGMIKIFPNSNSTELTVETINGGEPAVYITDILSDGGKVLKQESYKAIAIDKEGNVTEGRTKQKPKANKKYVLVEKD